jgi:bifunctional NMN adenylyltransferase/nudix hydrolase
MLEFGVFIGRFQPPHLAHEASFRRGLELFETLILVIGSAEVYPNIKNPFGFELRCEMVLAGLEPELKARVKCVPSFDEFEREDLWLEGVRQAVKSVAGSSTNVGLLSYIKDSSGYYQKSFPEWPVFASGVESDLNATDVRVSMLEGRDDWREMVSPGVRAMLEAWMASSEFPRLQREYRAVKAWKLEASKMKYPVIGVAVDSLVGCAGHVLLVERAGTMGKGAWALPGGFLEPTETTKQGAIRELLEETSLKLEIEPDSSRTFDWPTRSVRGRVISHAFHFSLEPDGSDGEPPPVKAADDAARAFWLPLVAALESRGRFHDDHWFMLRWFTQGF